MYGTGNSAKPDSIAWPQPTPYTTDIEKAKALDGRVQLSRRV
jgi:hypothetical protein